MLLHKILPEDITAISATFVGSDDEPVDTFGVATRSYTIGSISVSASDTLVVCVGQQSSTSDYGYLVSCTVNSVSATEAVATPNPGSYSSDQDRYSLGIYYVTGITASSLTIATSVSGTDVVRSACVVYKIPNNSLTVTDTDFAKQDHGSQSLTNTVALASYEAAIVVGTYNVFEASGNLSYGATVDSENTIITDTFCEVVAGEISGVTDSTYDIVGTSSDGSITAMATAVFRA